MRTKVQAQSALDHSWSSQSSKQSVDGLDRHISLSFCTVHSDKSRSLMDTEQLASYILPDETIERFDKPGKRRQSRQ
jgi:hypothetical protein